MFKLFSKLMVFLSMVIASTMLFANETRQLTEGKTTPNTESTYCVNWLVTPPPFSLFNSCGKCVTAIVHWKRSDTIARYNIDPYDRYNTGQSEPGQIVGESDC